MRMQPTELFSDRLRQGRGKFFVGRESELQQLENKLGAAGGVVFIHAPGGMGKTELLRAFQRRVEERGLPQVFVDCSAVDPSPLGLELCFSKVLPALASGGVLLLDTFEAHERVERLYWSQFFPRLAAQVLVVIGGRLPPSTAWSLDLGWQGLLATVELPSLSSSETSEYLLRRGLGEEARERSEKIVRGYPLAMGLVADLFQRHQADPTLVDSSDMKELVRWAVASVLETAPSPGHQAALLASSLPMVVTPATLTAMLGRREVGEYTSWLSGLSCIKLVPGGFLLHDLFRDALLETLVRDWPEQYIQFVDRIGVATLAGYEGAAELQERMVLYAQLLFQWRGTEPAASGYLARMSSSLFCDALRESDVPALQSAMDRTGPKRDTGWLARWQKEQPERCYVFRDELGTPHSFLQVVRLEKADDYVEDEDLVVAQAARFALTHLQDGTKRAVDVYRYWTALETGRAKSSALAEISALVTMLTHNVEDVAMWFGFMIGQIDAHNGGEFLDIGVVDRFEELDIVVDDVTYFGFGRSFVAESQTSWRSFGHSVFVELAKRQLRGRELPKDDELKKAFVYSLEQFHSDSALAESPFPGLESVGQDTRARADALRELIRELLLQLEMDPHLAEAVEVMKLVLQEPTLKQVAAAARLNMSHRTYRRRRGEGLDALVFALRARTHDSLGPPPKKQKVSVLPPTTSTS